MRNIEIVAYTQQDLKRLLADEQFWAQPQLPITKRRAISSLSNPRAVDSDTVLITALSKGQLIAYIGILPDVLRSNDQQTMRFGWTTTWWVETESTNKLSAAMVMFAALKKYPKRIAGSNPSKEAERAWVATKLFRECARFDRSYFIMAPPPSLRFFSPPIRWTIGAKNRMIFDRKLGKHGLEIRTVGAFDEPFESFVNTRAIRDPLARDTAYWNWVLNFPWLSTSPEDEAAQKSYAFSVFAKDFRQIPLLVFRHGAVIAFLVMTLREGRLTLKYADYDLCDTADVATALQVAVADINPWLFICPDSELSAMLKRLFPFYLARHSKSSAIYAVNGLPLSVGWHPHWGSGDKIFT